MENTIIELQQLAITAQSDLIAEKQKNINLNNKFSAALRCLLKIKDAYLPIYEECLTEDDIKSILGPR